MKNQVKQGIELFRGAALPPNVVEGYANLKGKRDKFGKQIKMALFGFTATSTNKAEA